MALLPMSAQQEPSRRYTDQFLDPVVPLFTSDPKTGVQPHGTGLLVRHEGSLFLISARHTFLPLRKSEALYLYGPDQYRIAGQLRSSKGISPLDGTGEDVDIGVVRLDPEPVLGSIPLVINNLGGHVRPEGGEELVICGYPVSKTEVRKRHREIRAIAYVHSGSAVAPSKVAKMGINPRFRIAMEFHTRKVLALGGKRQRAPHPMGMSGSPIWMVNQVGDGSFKIGVIGIMTDYLPDQKVLVGTTIAAAVGVIQDFGTGHN